MNPKCLVLLAMILSQGQPSMAPAQVVANLHPSGAGFSIVNSVDNGQQVGNAEFGPSRASLWSGTAASWVDLHPAGATMSFARGVHNGQQVGFAEVGAVFRAGLWSGTAASWVDLHPTGVQSSRALSVHNGQQVGDAFIGSRNTASLWNGTAASWVDLHPVTTGGSSIALSVHNGQQVGYTSFVFGLQNRASLWNGTAASWVDLTPAGATQSEAHGVHNGLQVGFAEVGGVQRASLWSGTADSWVDLSLDLTGSWGSTDAQSIWRDGTTIYIGGTGFNNSTNRFEALLWTRPVPEPSSILLASLATVQILHRFRKRAS